MVANKDNWYNVLKKKWPPDDMKRVWREISFHFGLTLADTNSKWAEYNITPSDDRDLCDLQWIKTAMASNANKAGHISKNK